MEDPIGDLLRTVRVVAVLGAHREPHRPACYVPEDLYQAGFRVLPVNPTLVGEVRWGEPFHARLDALAEPVDVVDVFRRPDQLPGHLDEILAMRPLPRWVWLQSGIRHPEFAAALRAAGVQVVEDRCMLAERRARGISHARRDAGEAG